MTRPSVASARDTHPATPRRTYSSQPPRRPSNNTVKFWPFLAIIVVGTGAFAYMSKSRAGQGVLIVAPPLHGMRFLTGRDSPGGIYILSKSHNSRSKAVTRFCLADVEEDNGSDYIRCLGRTWGGACGGRYIIYLSTATIPYT
ncbi:hypothetical protein F4861DRAFT_237412 [Xylaria intraflava]|nr:hypothetical protein F4861DRAFT_237412 [Xylaria intraflava]